MIKRFNCFDLHFSWFFWLFLIWTIKRSKNEPTREPIIVIKKMMNREIITLGIKGTNRYSVDATRAISAPLALQVRLSHRDLHSVIFIGLLGCLAIFILSSTNWCLRCLASCLATCFKMNLLINFFKKRKTFKYAKNI